MYAESLQTHECWTGRTNFKYESISNDLVIIGFFDHSALVITTCAGVLTRKFVWKLVEVANHPSISFLFCFVFFRLLYLVFVCVWNSFGFSDENAVVSNQKWKAHLLPQHRLELSAIFISLSHSSLSFLSSAIRPTAIGCSMKTKSEIPGRRFWLEKRILFVSDTDDLIDFENGIRNRNWVIRTDSCLIWFSILSRLVYILPIEKIISEKYV